VRPIIKPNHLSTNPLTELYTPPQHIDEQPVHHALLIGSGM